MPARTQPTVWIWLAALWLAWAALLFGGFARGRLDASGRRAPVQTRITSSLVLVLAAWSWYLLGVTMGTHRLVGLLLAIGMSLGALGDMFMARLLPVADRVPWGMGAFGLGHVAYVSSLLVYAGEMGLTVSGPLAIGGIAWLLMGAAAWYALVWRGGRRSALVGAALAYALLLASTPGVATVLALQLGVLSPVALGGALFLISDMLLAAQLFGEPRSPLARTWRRGLAVDDVVWLTYGPAQMLIVYGLSLAIHVWR